MYPENYRYTKEHEWVAIEGDRATIGITDHAQNELGDIVYVDLPRAGDAVAADKTMGSVESVKAVSDIYSPVTGEVIEVNTTLPDKLEILSTDPYTEGWIAKIRITDDSNLGNLLDFAAYQKQCEEEGH